jgi:cyclopropane-fatty-acyl-phospholipid synthase
VADVVGPLLDSILERRPAVRIECWDASTFEPAGPAVGTIRLRSPDAIRHLLWAPGELGLARAYVAGAIDLDGDVVAIVAALRQVLGDRRPFTPAAMRAAGRAASELGVVGRRPPAPLEEARPRGWRHSLRRDAQAISHHYDVGNEFYELVLGSAMTYSCAYFAEADLTLAEAQAAKHELICRKLGLHEQSGLRLLDVGCGWGSMALHAARHHGAHVVGITISREQARHAQQRVAEAGLAELVDIRVQDYRELRGEQFDAISSIGMFEHVGRERWAEYFETLRSLLTPRGRLVNHAISKVGGSRLGRRSFMYRYVFPDGELADVGDTVLAMERAGFEVRDVESLREHYAQTLRAWVANLERDWDRAVELVGPARARVWRLYMAGSVDSFERNLIAIHQVLGVATDEHGASGMPRTRSAWAVPSLAPTG